LTTYPDSPYTIEARARYNSMRDLLAEHEYRVAHFYFKRGAYVAAKGRYDVIFSAFPDFKSFDKALFEAGWTESRLGHGDDAHTLWERLAKEYPASPLVKKLPARTAPAAEPAGTATAATAATGAP
jgi:outer membrane protein assembly factor BamD